MAFFGAPVSHEDDEERAVRCCLELLQLPGGPFRAGVTTGSVYCGEVGSDARREYAVIGDSVNLAARLMQAAEPGQLLDRPPDLRAGRATPPSTTSSAPITRQGQVRAGSTSGRSTRCGTGPRRPAPRRPPASPLVGREAEVARAQALVGRALAGEGQVVCLTGEAGIGKSRLGAEIVRIGASGLGFAVYGGACRSHGTTTSYLVWRSIWRDLLDIDTSLPIAEQQAQLARPDRPARDGGSGAAGAAAGAGRSTSPCPTANSPPPSTRSPATSCCGPPARLPARSATATTPLLLVLEDCHWIDPASTALLEFLAPHVADQPVLILVTARGRRPTRRRCRRCPGRPCRLTDLRLGELAGTDAERLVGLRLRQRYGADSVAAPEVVRRLTERGEGNPFYLEELVSYLHARGIDPRDPRALAALELPDGLQRLVMARIDQLGEGEKATIKVASVIGRRFRARWISEGYPPAGRPEEVERHLERLHQLDLMPRRRPRPSRSTSSSTRSPRRRPTRASPSSMREALHERVGLLIERDLSRPPRPVRRHARPPLRAHAGDSTSSESGSGRPATRPRRPSPTRPPSTTTTACSRSSRRSRPARYWSSWAPSGTSPASGPRPSRPSGRRWRSPRGPVAATSLPRASGTSATCSCTPSRMRRR